MTLLRGVLSALFVSVGDDFPAFEAVGGLHLCDEAIEISDPWLVGPDLNTCK